MHLEARKRGLARRESCLRVAPIRDDQDMRMDLTDAFIRGISAKGPIEYSDAKCTGLKLRVSAAGKKTFALKAKSHLGKTKTVTLGEYPDMGLREARDAALDARRQMKDGRDVTAERRAKRVALSTAPTLRELVLEYREVGGVRTKIWRPRSENTLPEAQSAIFRVFEPILDRQITILSAEDFAEVMGSYEPKQRRKTSANGSVSRARSYLSTVLHWSAGRKRFGKIGAGRTPRVDAANIEETHDPADSDPTITGKRERVLTEDELAKLLPLMKYPAPASLTGKLDPEDHLRPAAHRFILLTCARLREVAEMCWGDVDFRSGIWTKVPIDKRSTKDSKMQRVPLSDAAMKLLADLPSAKSAASEDLVFPNSVGNVEGNWSRGTTALQEASGTTDWTRHDLRRTSSTILHALHTPIDTIADILGHTNSSKRTGLSGAIEHYIVATRILNEIEDVRKVHLDRLARVLDTIESRADDADGVDAA